MFIFHIIDTFHCTKVGCPYGEPAGRRSRRMMRTEKLTSLNGDLQPYNAAEEINYLSNRFSLGEERTLTVGCAGRMVRRFQVSTQAMQIRLTGVGLVRLQKGSSELFDRWAGTSVSTCSNKVS